MPVTIYNSKEIHPHRCLWTGRRWQCKACLVEELKESEALKAFNKRYRGPEELFETSQSLWELNREMKKKWK